MIVPGVISVKENQLLQMTHNPCVCVCVEIFFYRGFHKLCVFFLENLINWQKRHVRFFRLSVKIVGSDGCVFLDSLAAEGILGNDSISLNCSQNISRLINQNSLHSWVLHRHSRGHEPHVEDLWSRGLFVFVFSAQTCYSHLGVCCLHPDRGSQGALDLTELIGVPLPPSVSFVTGFEGYPAYSFGPEANVGRLTKSFIPDPFYSDFAITVMAKATTRRGGVLFAITDALQKVSPAESHLKKKKKNADGGKMI